MTNPYRVMCAELIDALEGGIPAERLHMSPLADRARALLDQPVAEGPTDEALVSFTAWFCKNYPGPDTIIHKPKWHAPKVFRAAACAIARFGHPTPQPVAEGLSNEEIEEWADACPDVPLEEMDPEVHGWRRCFTAKEFSETIRAAIARWGHQ